LDSISSSPEGNQPIYGLLTKGIVKIAGMVVSTSSDEYDGRLRRRSEQGQFQQSLQPLSGGFGRHDRVQRAIKWNPGAHPPE
jgi:hypothetical protein